jgi:segregation and condensation protein B
MNIENIKNIVEASILAASKPLSVDQLLTLFGDGEKPEKAKIRKALGMLKEDYSERGAELVEVASGFRMQVNTKYTEWVSRLWQERPPKYSRALLETLAIIAYRQPATRGDVEQIRGVAVSTNIIRTLEERGWIRVLGHRDVPGRPAMFGTSKEFLDYFGLKKLDELPSLAEIRDLDSMNVEMDLDIEPKLRVTTDDSEDDMDRKALLSEEHDE